ncbi:MAG: sugar phosphate isomerase/epimerase family protein [Thermoguttaceae bacterium]
MWSTNVSRRRFINEAAVLGGSVLLTTGWNEVAQAEPHGKLNMACNQYPWSVFYSREGRDFSASLDTAFAEVARSGVDGFEPAVTSPEQAGQIADLLKKHGLEMRSLYVNSILHSAPEVDKSIAQIMAIAQRVKPAGTRIIVTNPSPIRWGGPENKDDAQLNVQAAALDRLGSQLRGIGITLAYHNHDIELRNAAREFHHMMLGTDPKNVTFCLDAHWVYRGAGNSAVALFDVLKLYGPRVSELHLRQSRDGIWTETLGDGDIDYRALAKYLLHIGVKPHLVLEQCPEKGTPKTMDAVESHRQSREYANRVFADFAA